MAYIYKITNQINGKIYIGKTYETMEKEKAHMVLFGKTAKNLTFLKNYVIIYIEKLKKRLFKNQSNRGNSLGEINFRGEFAKGFIPFA